MSASLRMVLLVRAPYSPFMIVNYLFSVRTLQHQGRASPFSPFSSFRLHRTAAS